MRAMLGWVFAVVLMAGGVGFLVLTFAACVQVRRGEDSSEVIGAAGDEESALERATREQGVKPWTAAEELPGEPMTDEQWKVFKAALSEARGRDLFGDDDD